MQAERLLEFEGYGGADPRVFFIGLEENGGDDQQNVRRQTPPRWKPACRISRRRNARICLSTTWV